MYKQNKVVLLIPARGGSKRIPGKNLKPFCGKPLIAYAVEAVLGSKHGDEKLVSTDDKEIAKVSNKLGVEVPFLRPPELSGDDSSMFSVMKHALVFLEEKAGQVIDILVLVQPTNPLVSSSDIDLVIEKLVETGTNSCVTVSEISERPEWMYKVDGERIIPAFPCPSRELRSQELAEYWKIACSVYANRRQVLIGNKTVLDFGSLSYVKVPKERFADIDDIFDFELAELRMERLKKRTRSSSG